mgnify:CR=1 FL=1
MLSQGVKGNDLNIARQTAEAVAQEFERLKTTARDLYETTEGLDQMSGAMGKLRAAS